MENDRFFLHDPSNGEKANRGKTVMRESVGISQKKTLTDITNNMEQRPRIKSPLKQQAKLQLATDISTQQLLKENAMLMQVLANRNAIIESYKAELQKSQINFQKLQKQNSELAMTNSRMLAELNSNRQRLREVQHELGSKNGMLKAMKLEAKEHTEKLKCEIEKNQAGASQSKKPDQMFPDDRGDNVCHAKRKRVSKSQSSAPAVVKQVKPVNSQRYSLRRQSKAEKPRQPEDDFIEVDEIKYDVSHLQENLTNESEETSLGSKVHDEAREDAESSEPTNSEQVLPKRNLEKKRQSLRRQSSRFNPEKLEPTKDSFEIDDAKFAIPPLCDDMSEKCVPATSSLTSRQENMENDGCKFDPQEIRRSSVGRPKRQSVTKIQSYKEVPLNMKMRRPT